MFEGFASSKSASSGPHAVVFAWHAAPSGGSSSSSRSGSYEVGGRNNMFRVAVRSVKDAHPQLPIFVFTNGIVSDPDTRSRVTIITVDLLKESGLDELLRGRGDKAAAVREGVKIQALLTGAHRSRHCCCILIAFFLGWRRNILPPLVVYLDVDIVITSATPQFNILEMLKPLKVCVTGFLL
jgi:hypothetical protein